MTLPRGHCVQVPWEYINFCGYSDQFCKKYHILHVHVNACADLGGGTAGPCPPFWWIPKDENNKKKEREGRKKGRKRKERREKKERNKENGKLCMYKKNILKILSNKSIIVSIVQTLIRGRRASPPSSKKGRKKHKRKGREKREKE